MADVLEFPYKPKVLPMLGAVAFFGLCTVIGAYAASTNDKGLIINNLIELSVGGATLFWWCLAALSALFVAGGAYGLYLNRAAALTVRLTPTELSAPRRGFSRQVVVIPLREIRSVDLGAYGKQRWLAVQSTSGDLHLPESMLPSPAAFETLHQALLARAGAGAAMDAAGHRPSLA
jgi:hypothetical protein